MIPFVRFNVERQGTGYTVARYNIDEQGCSYFAGKLTNDLGNVSIYFTAEEAAAIARENEVRANERQGTVQA